MKIQSSVLAIPLLGLLVSLLGTAFVSSGSSHQALPTRPPTATPPQQGATITLQLYSDTPVSSSLWTAIQWQASDGRWHEVEGWQGNPNEQLQVIWWVADKDLATGPFRWAVYESEEKAAVIAESEAFFLPNDKQALAVDLMIP